MAKSPKTGAELKVERVAKRVRPDSARPKGTFVVKNTGSALPPSAAAVMQEIANDPKKGKAFLVRAGILTKAGKLRSEYSA